MHGQKNIKLWKEGSSTQAPANIRRHLAPRNDVTPGRILAENVLCLWLKNHHINATNVQNHEPTANSEREMDSKWASPTWDSLIKMAFLISNFRRVLNVVCFLLGNSPASELYMPTFRNTLSVLSSYAGRCEEWLDFQAKPSQSSKWGRRLARSASRSPPVC